MSVSAAGPVAYRTLSADSGQRQLVWIDRSGRETRKGGLSGHCVARVRRCPMMAAGSPLFRYANGNMDIWTYDTSRQRVGSGHVRLRG